MSNVRDHQSTQPVIRFKGFTDAWEKRKLGEVVKKVKSYSLSRDVERDEITGYKYVHYGDIHTGVANIITCQSDLPNIEPAKYEELRQNDLVVADASEDYQGIAEPALVLEEPRTHLVSGLHTIALRPKTSNGLYLYYLLHTASFKHFGYRTGTGLKVFGISWPNLSKFEFFIPTRAEQDRIVVVFEHLDNLIAVNQRKGDVLQNLKKGLLQRLFASETSPIPDIRFKGFTDAWEKRKLKELGDTYSGLSGKTKEDFGHGEARYVTYMNVFTNPVADPVGTEATEIDTKQNEVMKNDVFFTTSSETPEEVGMSSVWPIETRNVYLNSFCFGYRVLNQSSLNFLFIAQQLRSPSFRKRMIILAQGISRYNISKKKVLEIPIFRPSLNEQNKIGYFLSNVDDLIAATQRKGEVLKNLKKALLQKMFV